MLYEGALQICNRAGDCGQVTERCEIGAASRTDAVVYQRFDPSRPPLSEQFRYARIQAQLLPEFRVSGVNNCVGAPAEAGTPESLSSSGGGFQSQPTTVLDDDDGQITQTPGATGPTTP